MRKRAISIMFLTLLLIPIAFVAANPDWIDEPWETYPWVQYKITGSGIHIAIDPLFDSSIVGAILPFEPGVDDLVKGWVTFTCNTDNPTQKNAPKGFDFSVTVKDIPAGSYDVVAHPTVAYIPNDDPPPDVLIVPSIDFGFPPYALGTINVGGDGEGELDGFYDLPAGFYAWRITVVSSGTPVLETHEFDAADFGVIS